MMFTRRVGVVEVGWVHHHLGVCYRRVVGDGSALRLARGAAGVQNHHRLRPINLR